MSSFNFHIWIFESFQQTFAKSRTQLPYLWVHLIYLKLNMSRIQTKGNSFEEVVAISVDVDDNNNNVPEEN